MCEAHEAAGIACTPSMESIGGAIIGLVKAAPGIILGLAAAVSVAFIVANAVWFGLGVLAVGTVAGAVLVRKTVRNLSDGPVWHPALAQTQTRLNGAQRPAVDAPRWPAIEAPGALPADVLAVMGARGLLGAVRDGRR